jgi:hypothetical protein
MDVVAKDPSADVYKMMDKAHLNAGHILTAKQSTAKTIEQIRTSIAKQVTDYILARDEALKGVK